jgi:hypothetical protein
MCAIEALHPLCPHLVPRNADGAAAFQSRRRDLLFLDRTAGAWPGPWDDDPHVAGAVFTVNRAEALT